MAIHLQFPLLQSTTSFHHRRINSHPQPHGLPPGRDRANSGEAPVITAPSIANPRHIISPIHTHPRRHLRHAHILRLQQTDIHQSRHASRSHNPRAHIVYVASIDADLGARSFSSFCIRFPHVCQIHALICRRKQQPTRVPRGQAPCTSSCTRRETENSLPLSSPRLASIVVVPPAASPLSVPPRRQTRHARPKTSLRRYTALERVSLLPPSPSPPFSTPRIVAHHPPSTIHCLPYTTVSSFFHSLPNSTTPSPTFPSPQTPTCPPHNPTRPRAPSRGLTTSGSTTHPTPTQQTHPVVTPEDNLSLLPAPEIQFPPCRLSTASPFAACPLPPVSAAHRKCPYLLLSLPPQTIV